MKFIKDIAIMLFLATLWFVSAYYTTAALFPFWAFQCGLINLIIGLLCIAIINRSPAGSRLLYEGEKENEELGCSKIVVWVLIGAPPTIFFIGTGWWLMRLLGFFGFD